MKSFPKCLYQTWFDRLVSVQVTPMVYSRSVPKQQHLPGSNFTITHTGSNQSLVLTALTFPSQTSSGQKLNTLTPATHDLGVIFPSSQSPSSCTSGEFQEGKQDGCRFFRIFKRSHIQTNASSAKPFPPRNSDLANKESDSMRRDIFMTEKVLI